MLRLILFLVFISLSSFVHAQHEEHQEREESSHEMKHHRVSIVISHTRVPKALGDTEPFGALIIPSWGLNYEYWINEKWAIGLHNDIEIADYIIETNEGRTLERERPIIVSLVGIYNPWRGLELLAGFGKEFETHENFWVYRLGVEYELELHHHWDVAPSLVFDLKENVYDSWTLGVVIGKRF